MSTTSTDLPTSERSDGGRSLWLLAIAIVLLLGYWNVLLRLASIWWTKPDYGHGFAVPVVSAAYVWLRRERLLKAFRDVQPTSTVVLGVALLLAAAMIRIVGILGRALPVEAFSLIPMAGGLCLILLGRSASLRLLPACLFLVFMIPLPGGFSSQLRSRLQGFATNISVFSLQTMGVPALQRGNVIVLPDAEVGVAEACSGLRMLMTFAALVTAATMFLKRTWLDNTVLLLAIIPIALIVNAWRVVTVSLATQYAPKWADTVHDAAGFMMMLLAMAILWGVLKFLDALFSDADTQAVSSPKADSSFKTTATA